MIKSMTAFARQDVQAEWGGLSCEIRSVNHRYLEPQLRLPDVLRGLEPELREQVRDSLGRGKVEISLRLQEADLDAARFSVDKAVAENVYQATRDIRAMMDDPAPVNPLDILRWPGVMVSPTLSVTEVANAARQVFAATLGELTAARLREGERLMPMLTQRLGAVEAQVIRVRQRMPELLEAQKKQWRARLEEVVTTVDEDRLAQELVIAAQKADVAEELDRLEAHVQEVRDALTSEAPVGRRLDFLMQELNREANTLSSKSCSADVTAAAVELKVLIEQMREQVQNVE